MRKKNLKSVNYNVLKIRASYTINNELKYLGDIIEIELIKKIRINGSLLRKTKTKKIQLTCWLPSKESYLINPQSWKIIDNNFKKEIIVKDEVKDKKLIDILENAILPF